MAGRRSEAIFEVDSGALAEALRQAQDAGAVLVDERAAAEDLADHGLLHSICSLANQSSSERESMSRASSAAK